MLRKMRFAGGNEICESANRRCESCDVDKCTDDVYMLFQSDTNIII